MFVMRVWYLALVLPVILAAQADNPELIFRRAVSMQAAGDYEAAVQQYRAYLKIDPNRVDAISNLGAALARLGRLEEAVTQYRLALSKQDNPAVRMNLALAHYKLGEIPAAITELDRLHKAYPDHTRVTQLLADCYFRSGEFERVIALLTPLEAKTPDDRAVAYLLGMSLISANRVKEGERIINRLFKGDTAEAHLLLGASKLRINDLHGARDELARAVQLNPKLPGLQSLYGSALREAGDDEPAMQAYRKALEDDPIDFEANLYLGANMRQEGNYDEALKYLNRALHVRPGDPGVRYQIGATMLGRGELQPALNELEKLVKEYPNFLEAHVSLATLYYRLRRKEDGDRERAIVQKLQDEARKRDAK